MKFSASIETHRDFGGDAFDIMRVALAFFPDRLARGVLGRLDVELCYVPILMPEELMCGYPARSGIDRTRRVIHGSPQLDADGWAAASVEGRIAIYARGLRKCAPLLREMGATDTEIRTLLVEVDAFAAHAAHRLDAPGT